MGQKAIVKGNHYPVTAFIFGQGHSGLHQRSSTIKHYISGLQVRDKIQLIEFADGIWKERTVQKNWKLHIHSNSRSSFLN